MLLPDPIEDAVDERRRLGSPVLADHLDGLVDGLDLFLLGRPLNAAIAYKKAEALARAGVGSLRFDRRGISDGSDWRQQTFSENTRDAAAALSSRGCRVQVSGDGYVAAQKPAAGEKLLDGVRRPVDTLKGLIQRRNVP